MEQTIMFTWRQHIDLSADHLAQKLAKELRASEDPLPSGYVVEEDDVANFLTDDVVLASFWERLGDAEISSVQWGHEAGRVLAVVGKNIDVSPRAEDLDAKNDSENNAVEALTNQILPILGPLLEQYSDWPTRQSAGPA